MTETKPRQVDSSVGDLDPHLKRAAHECFRTYAEMKAAFDAGERWAQLARRDAKARNWYEGATQSPPGGLRVSLEFEDGTPMKMSPGERIDVACVATRIANGRCVVVVRKVAS